MLTRKIDLVLGPKAPKDCLWAFGDSHYIESWISDLPGILSRLATEKKCDYFLLWNVQAQPPEGNTLDKLATSNAEIIHAGLRLCAHDFFPNLHLIKQDWSMIDAPQSITSTSWRVSLDACLVEAALLSDQEWLEPAYETTGAAGLDFGLRCQEAGVLVEYSPELLLPSSYTCIDPPTRRDFFLFVFRHFGILWTVYALIRQLLSRPIGLIPEISDYIWAKKQFEGGGLVQDAPVSKEAISFSTGEIAENQHSVSVIIPTLGRYGYLEDAIDSLRKQTIPPAEIIVVDQNPPESRQEDFYEKFGDLPLHVIRQDELGQSLARNTGVLAASGKYIFLFDDDSIASPNLIETHLAVLRIGRYDVSTGVSFPPPAENYRLPERYRHFRTAQTFDTGNSMVPRSIYIKVGGLDRNYDFGPGTDSDFGTRLYLAGYRILHNAQAQRIHFKAPTGGLRVHKSVKYNTDSGLFDPFPPITQSYYALKYVKNRPMRERIWLMFVTSHFTQGKRSSHRWPGWIFVDFLLFLFKIPLYPFKKQRSLRAARKLISQGVRGIQTAA